ncbi:MAG: cysteine hydrolase [Bryobacterales bacterium]|nr:cysteine hydrolase [Bryobacterales bacterium]
MPESIALVVIDLQYASASRTTGYGRWLRERSREQEGTYRFDRIERMVVPNTQQLLQFFRSHGLAILFVKLGSQVHDFGDLVPYIRTLEKEFQNRKGNREFEILDEIAPAEGEPVLVKVSASAFNSSNLDAVLKNRSLSQLVCVGVSTSQCVDLTARDAADRGYDVVIVEDAVAEDSPEHHEATLEQFERLFGQVMTAKEVIKELRRAI